MKKALKILPCLLFLMLSYSTTVLGINTEPSLIEREAINQVISLFVENWNRHDHKGMADLWIEEGDLIAADARWARNKSEVEKLFLQEQTGYMRESGLSLTIQNIYLFASNVAWVDANGVIYNIIDAPGVNRSFEHHVFFC